jgi:WD40 repeat protein
MALIQLVHGARERNLIEGHTDKVNDVSFSPDGKTIASVSNDGTIRLWSLDGKLLQPPFLAKEKKDTGCEVHILSLSFSPDSRTTSLDKQKS